MTDKTASGRGGTDFIRQIVTAHVDEGRYEGVVTRFPPEPNGYLHIGHAKSLCLNFGIAQEFGGRCHLRFDDTNPETEELEYVEAIQGDIRWLGFDWGEHLYFASDYFERMYECAVVLIRKGLAYVDSSTEDEIREARGTVTEPGRPTRYRDRSVEENLDLFRRMRAGEFADGAHVLRGRIDLASPNMLMRDPVFYRIRHAHHYRQGDAWCIYPLYDYAHCLEDAFEGVTHSLCTLEFDNNREIYDWILDNVGFEEPRTHQYEFNRLNLEYTVVSKRKLRPLVESGYLAGWDDPRMATLAGLRRRGVPPEAIRLFADMVGVAKTESWVDPGKLEFATRDVLNRSAPRVMAVLDPLKVVISNLDDDVVEELEAPYWPEDIPRQGSRTVPFCRELLIERADFAEAPPKGFRRLVPGGEVRLRHAYVVRCDEVVRDPEGRVLELRCTYDPATRGGTSGGRKGIGTIHWVSARHALRAEVRLYDRLFSIRDPEELPDGGDLADNLNPGSLVVMREARVEPSVAGDAVGTRYQFERTGYFWRDPVDGVGDALVFNRIVTLKDTWGRRLTPGPAELKVETHPTVVTAPGAGRKNAPPAARGPELGARPPVSEERAGKRRADPELAARMQRYVDELGLSPEDADVLTGTRAFSDFFEAALAEHADVAAVASWMVNDLRGVMQGRPVGELPFGGPELGRLAGLVAAGAVSRRAAKDVLADMAEKGGDPAAVVARLGLQKLGDASALDAVVHDVLAAWPGKVAEFRAGRENLLGLFVGEVMKATRGTADPKAARARLLERLREAP
jgi:glutaminyl-tRNA synthetase